MCVAAVAWNAHPRWRLVVAANRDEFHERPTAPLTLWDDGTIAGRDLRAGGTWLGVNAAGRFALVTNHRVEGFPKPDRLTRGGLVTGWLKGEVLGDTKAMNPFNLFCAGPGGLRFVTNWPQSSETLPPGVHGISNGPYDHPWPKAMQLSGALSNWLEGDAGLAHLFVALRDETAREPVDSRRTDPEPRLSGVFIKDPVYGTRCSTVIAVDATGLGRIIERRFDAAGIPSGETELAFNCG
ncbi:NRDE family protein [Novosphingobium sp.]|uniref:NRDE family protein n=1 Tax=Novosphingobium sp. TaxID=1874826 RepID=UPI00286E3F9C|nr:NRDE family protein [Novosphingobium sp.]